MPSDPSLTPTAAFWLEALDTFDIHREGPQWNWSLRWLLPVLDDQDQVVGLVREAIVIQQFLLELVTRRGVHRDLVVDKLNSLLASQLHRPKGADCPTRSTTRSARGMTHHPREPPRGECRPR